MKFVIRTLVLHIFCILLFAFLYYYFRENYINGNEEITLSDSFLLSTTIQASVGMTNIYPLTLYGKIIMMIQQMILIMTHVITLYVFTI
jgi:hypothetical protein